MIDPADRMAAKQVLSGLCHALEEVAEAIADRGEDVVVLATFQWGAFFVQRAERFARLADAGALVIVAYTGDGPAPPGVHVAGVERSHPLVDEWSLAVVSPSVGGYVTGTDQGSLRDVTDRLDHDLEDDRMFEAAWGWNRDAAGACAARLLDVLADALPGDVAAQARAILACADGPDASVAEAAFEASLAALAARLRRREATIADLRSSVRALRDQADRDVLTGLVGRRGLSRWLGGESLAAVPVPRLGVLLIDLDGFKDVNDRYGHRRGDELLTEVSSALAAAVRAGDVVSRWGGDEFVVVCPGVDDAELAAIAERVRQAVAAVNAVGVTASIGAILTDRRDLSVDAVDGAMYEAKRAGGDCVRFAARVASSSR